MKKIFPSLKISKLNRLLKQTVALNLIALISYTPLSSIEETSLYVKYYDLNDLSKRGFLNEKTIVVDQDFWKQSDTQVGIALSLGYLSLGYLNDLASKEFQERETSDNALIGELIDQQVMSGSFSFSDLFPTEVVIEIGRLLARAFLEEMVQTLADHLRDLASDLIYQLDHLILHDSNPVSLDDLSIKLASNQQLTLPEEFQEIVSKIKESIDPNFNLICNTSFIEAHCSKATERSEIAINWFKTEIQNDKYMIAQYPEKEKNIIFGSLNKKDEGFSFLIFSKENIQILQSNNQQAYN